MEQIGHMGGYHSKIPTLNKWHKILNNFDNEAVNLVLKTTV